MRPAQLRRFARGVDNAILERQKAASMRPAQLRRFAHGESRSHDAESGGFNEAGAAAPVCLCHAAGPRGGKKGFNEAGAAAPVCPATRLFQELYF